MGLPVTDGVIAGAGPADPRVEEVEDLGSEEESIVHHTASVGDVEVKTAQADLLGHAVVRLADIETTALGVAYAVGLAVGVWKEDENLLRTL
ncbi:hypothetical protein Droror1_Dr00002470 [Drosera rotundifolia]